MHAEPANETRGTSFRSIAGRASAVVAGSFGLVALDSLQGRTYHHPGIDRGGQVHRCIHGILRDAGRESFLDSSTRAVDTSASECYGQPNQVLFAIT